MAGEGVHTVLEVGKILLQRMELFADVACMAMRGVVFDQGVGAGEQCGQSGGRGDPDALALRVFHEVGMVGVQLGKDGFAGQKEDDAFRSFRRLDVAFGNVFAVFLDVGAKAFAAVVVAGGRGEQGAVAFQRKFGVDAEFAVFAGQGDGAVGAAAVAQGVLVVHVLCGQDGVHQGFELAFAKGTAAALVGKNVLEVLQAAGKLVEAFLRFVNGGEAGDDVAEGVLVHVQSALQALSGVFAEAGDGLLKFFAQQGIMLLLQELLVLQVVAQFAELLLLVGGELLQLFQLALLLAAQEDKNEQAGENNGDDQPVDRGQDREDGVCSIHDALL